MDTIDESEKEKKWRMFFLEKKRHTQISEKTGRGDFDQ
jgi:hypothetical protein